MRIVFSILLLFSLTLPFFRINNNSSTDSAIEFVKDKLLQGGWGSIANEVITFSEKVIQEEKNSKTGVIGKTKHYIITGYGIGFSSIGALLATWNNYRFNRYEIVTIIPLFIILSTLLQLIFHNYFYKNRNAIIAIINMLLSLSVFGNCIGHENYTGYLYGIIAFLLIQISYMIYFYWFPYEKITKQDNEIQAS